MHMYVCDILDTWIFMYIVEFSTKKERSMQWICIQMSVDFDLYPVLVSFSIWTVMVIDNVDDERHRFGLQQVKTLRWIKDDANILECEWETETETER